MISCTSNLLVKINNYMVVKNFVFIRVVFFKLKFNVLYRLRNPWFMENKLGCCDIISHSIIYATYCYMI